MSVKRWGILLAAACVSLDARAEGPPILTIAIGGRTACVTPSTKHFARSEGAYIDAQITSSGALAANLSGCVAANAYLGRTGMARHVLTLEQELEINCSDPRISTCTVTLASTLVGYIRSKYRASACVMVAAAALTPVAGGRAPITIAHSPSCVSGTDGRLCNEQLAPLVVPDVPLGKYVLSAEFIIEVVASGLCDAHSAADFSASAALPPDFVRLRDPFQNTDKKNFGFTIALAATAPGDTLPRLSSVRPVSHTIQQKPVTSERKLGTAFERARAPFVH